MEHYTGLNGVEFINDTLIPIVICRIVSDIKERSDSMRRDSPAVERAYERWEVNNRITKWGERLTIIGSAIVGIGAVLFALALLWKPRYKEMNNTVEFTPEIDETPQNDNEEIEVMATPEQGTETSS